MSSVMEVTGLPCNAMGGTAPCPACLPLTFIFLQASPLLFIMPLPGKEQGASKVLQGWTEPPPTPSRGVYPTTQPWLQCDAETHTACEGDTSPLSLIFPSHLRAHISQGLSRQTVDLQRWALREGTRNNRGAFHPALEQGQGLDKLPRSQPAMLGHPFSPSQSSGSEGKQCLLLSDLPGRCGRVRNQTFLSLSPVP